MFVGQLIEAAGEAGESEVWLDFSFDCGYLPKDRNDYFVNGYDEVNRMLFGMIERPDKFISP